MLINEVCKITGLTKKAISYYEEENIIDPLRKDNGYREYSLEDVKRLKEISFYRNLDIGLKEIKIILNAKIKKEIINKILEEKREEELRLKIQRIYLKQVIDSNFDDEIIKSINKEVLEKENNRGEFIKKELVRIFPKGIGRYLTQHFSPYLNEKIDSEEKYKAWINIVEFLDDTEEFEIPSLIEMSYEGLNYEVLNQIAIETRNKIDEILNYNREELKNYKNELIENIKKQNDPSLNIYMEPINKFKKDLKEFFETSGYYDVFIPNLKIISKDYKEYQDKLIKLNELMEKELGLKYDANMKIILR